MHTVRLVRTDTDGRLTAEDFAMNDILSEMEARGFKKFATEPYGTRLRPELQGLPKFSGIIGPMWGGEGIARYESGPAYNILSA